MGTLQILYGRAALNKDVIQCCNVDFASVTINVDIRHKFRYILFSTLLAAVGRTVIQNISEDTSKFARQRVIKSQVSAVTRQFWDDCTMEWIR